MDRNAPGAGGAVASRRGTIVGWCVQDYRVLSSSADQLSPASPNSAVAAIEQPLALAESVISTPSPALSRARELRESVMLTEDSPDVGHTGNTAALEFNAAERDLERGPSLVDSDSDDGGGT